VESPARAVWFGLLLCGGETWRGRERERERGREVERGRAIVPVVMVIRIHH
jgi:hypothetical protein